jgi:hypothetical protein
MRHRILRLALLFSSIAWTVSIFGVFAPWSAASTALEGLGANPLPHDPMLDYWLRMAAAAFTLVGIWYFILFLNPHRFANALPYFGWLMIIEGLVLLTHGLRLQLPPDTAACLLAGAGILIGSHRVSSC